MIEEIDNKFLTCNALTGMPATKECAAAAGNAAVEITKCVCKAVVAVGGCLLDAWLDDYKRHHCCHHHHHHRW